jgi:hypothetical protein
MARFVIKNRPETDESNIYLEGQVPVNETVRIPHIYSTNFVLGTRWSKKQLEPDYKNKAM